MRTIASGLLAALRAESPELVLLVDLWTGLTSPSVVRFTPRETAVTWDGNTYEHRPVQIENEIEQSNEGETGGVALVVGNADRYFEDLRDDGADFQRVKCVVRVTTADRLSASPAEAVSDTFYVESIAYREGSVRLELLSRFSLFRSQGPRGTMTRAEFPGLPRNPTGL